MFIFAVVLLLSLPHPVLACLEPCPPCQKRQTKPPYLCITDDNNNEDCDGTCHTGDCSGGACETDGELCPGGTAGCIDCLSNGTCVPNYIFRCFGDLGWGLDCGYCDAATGQCTNNDSFCDPGESCCYGVCYDPDTQECCGTAVITKCDPYDCMDCNSVSEVCEDIGCDCEILGEGYNMSVGSVSDDCGNTLTLTFNGNVYCYYYNGLKVGNCPYSGGVNNVMYYKTVNEKRFYATYFKSKDDENDGSAEDEGDGTNKYDSVIWIYDCIFDLGPLKEGIEHPTVQGGDDGTGSGFEELSCP